MIQNTKQCTVKSEATPKPLKMSNTLGLHQKPITTDTLDIQDEDKRVAHESETAHMEKNIHIQNTLVTGVINVKNLIVCIFISLFRLTQNLTLLIH